MTVTVTGNAAGGTTHTVGPGLPMTLQSDTSTFPTGGSWSINLSNGSSQFVSFQVPNAFNFQQVWPWTNRSGMTQGFFGSGFPAEAGTTVNVQVDLKSSSSIVIDQTTPGSPTPLQWDPVSGLGQQITFQPTGGLTAPEQAQLASAATDSAAALAGVQTTINQGGTAISTTLGQLFGGFTLDSLAVTDLSGGVTCDPINITLVGAPFGVIIEATTVPDFYPFTAPGDQWTPLDLAVVQFVRGTDVLKRFGMHTRKHMEYPLPGVLLGLGTLIDLPLLPPDYHLEVWWGNGVCGQVFGLKTP